MDTTDTKPVNIIPIILTVKDLTKRLISRKLLEVGRLFIQGISSAFRQGVSVGGDSDHHPQQTLSRQIKIKSKTP